IGQPLGRHHPGGGAAPARPDLRQFHGVGGDRYGHQHADHGDRCTAVMTPLATHMVEATGFSLEAVLNAQVLGFSNPVMTYESPPLVVAMALGGIGVGSAQRLCLWLSLITMLVLWPIDYLWWQFLGLL